jgi:hypothetical protein
MQQHISKIYTYKNIPLAEGTANNITDTLSLED